MKKKFLFGAIVSFFLIGLIAIYPLKLVHAVTVTEDVRSQISALLAQVQVLQKQIATIQSQNQSSSSTQAASGVATPVTLNEKESISLISDSGAPVRVMCRLVPIMAYGRGESVYIIQSLLKDGGYYPEGYVTGYFGKLTSAAVNRFQSDNGIKATGILDQATIERLRERMANKFPQCVPPASLSVTAPAAGDSWRVGEDHAIVWTSDGLVGAGRTVTITTAAPLPACLRSTPACAIAVPDVHPYVIADHVANVGSYSWRIPSSFSASNIGTQEITVVIDGTSVRGVSDPFVILANGSPAPISTSTLSIQTSYLPGGVIGQPYSASIAAIGGTGDYTWSISGSLPDGIARSQVQIQCFKAPCLQPLIIQGTPTTAGTYTFTAQVSDGTSTAQGSFSITVAPPVSSKPLSIVTDSFPDAVVGAAYSQPVQATGGTGRYTWSVVGGALPTGMTLRSFVMDCAQPLPEMTSNCSGITWSIVGTPTAMGIYTFVLQVSDGQQVVTRSMKIAVASATTLPPPILKKTATSSPSVSANNSDSGSQDQYVLMASALESMRKLLLNLLDQFSH